MIVDFSEKILITLLRHFDDLLYNNGYKEVKVYYNDIDGMLLSYLGAKKHNKDYKIEFFFSYGKLEISIGKPEKLTTFFIELLFLFMAIFGIPLFKKKIKQNIGRVSFQITNIIELMENIKIENITNNNYEEIIFYYQHFIQQHLIPVIRGEIWIDELLRNQKLKEQDIK
jgi:hypothetical protein